VISDTLRNAVIKRPDVLPPSKGPMLSAPPLGPAPRDPEPQTAPQGIDTGPVTAVGFASINVEIRTELEKRVLYAL
jgi:hypothetical protein